MIWLVLVGGHRPTVTLNWTPSDSPGVTQQCVYRGTAPGRENYDVPIKCWWGNSTNTYTDRSVVRGTTYYYTVEAIIGQAFSDPSNEASAQP